MFRTLIFALLVLAGTALATSVQAATAASIEVRADGAAGVVFGFVREANRGAGLPGARVSVDGRSTVTGSDGSFRIAGVAPGSHTLSVEFLGYQSASGAVAMGGASGLRADVTLAALGAGGVIELIEVRATREGQALALNQQRSSINYMNVVSADLLGRFPATNMAEATQRIPGVSIERDQGEGRYVNVRGAPLEFTNVSVDGVQLAAPNPSRRAVELDTIPPDVIASLEVTKALTPDMDGDAIAGQINIVTQSALDRDGLILRGSIGTGEYQLGDGDNDRANLTVGNQFGAERNVGALIAGSWSRTGRFTDNVETEFVRAGDRLLPEVSEIKDYEGERTRWGLTGRFDWRPDESNLLYLIASASKFKDEEYRNTFTIDYDVSRITADSDERAGLTTRATFDKELRERFQEQEIRTLNLGGEHFLDSWRIDWQTSWSEGKYQLPKRQQFIYRSTLRPRMSYDFSDPDRPVWTLRNADGSVLQEGINLPEGVYAFRRYNQRFEDAQEEEIGLRLDFLREQDFFGDAGNLKFGLRARLREKESNDDRNRNGVVADGPAYADLLCPRVSRNFGYVGFEFGRVMCNDIFDRFGPQVRNQNLLPLVQDSLVSDYAASEDIYAGYVRLDANWDRLTLVTGVRYEYTELSGRGALFDEDTGEAMVQSDDGSYGKLLPSVHLRYEADDDIVARASWSTAVSRPNFVDTVPRLVISDDDREASAGNPDLEATYSHNLDVSVERYFEPVGLLSAALFYKRLEDPIFEIVRVVEGGPLDGVRLTQPLNGRDGEIKGVELSWQQTFDMLPAPFDGLGVYANYTYTQSNAKAPLGLGDTDLPGTSRNNVNLAVFYEKAGFNARLSYNERSAFIQEFALNDSELDVYWDKRKILDFTTSYQVTDRWQVFGEINNITDSEQRRYQGSRNRVLELEEFGRYWLMGLRFDF